MSCHPQRVKLNQVNWGCGWKSQSVSLSQNYSVRKNYEAAFDSFCLQAEMNLIIPHWVTLEKFLKHNHIKITRVTGGHPNTRLMGLHLISANYLKKQSFILSSVLPSVPPDVNYQLTGKEPDSGKDWRQKEKRATEDEMVGWHHWHNGHELGQTQGDGGKQGFLACYSPWGHK